MEDNDSVKDKQIEELKARVAELEVLFKRSLDQNNADRSEIDRLNAEVATLQAALGLCKRTHNALPISALRSKCVVARRCYSLPSFLKDDR